MCLLHLHCMVLPPALLFYRVTFLNFDLCGTPMEQQRYWARYNWRHVNLSWGIAGVGHQNN